MREREETDMKEREWKANMCIIKPSQNKLDRTNTQVFNRCLLVLKKSCVCIIKGSPHIRNQLLETLPHLWKGFKQKDKEKNIFIPLRSKELLIKL